MLSYVRALPRPKLLLWCYLVWYLYFVRCYFDPDPRLWLNATGLSLLIGTALYVSTAYASAVRVPVQRWTTFRCYLMPFCVSSFAALIKGKNFVLIFGPNPRDNLEALGICAGVILLVEVSKRTARSASPAAAASVRGP